MNKTMKQHLRLISLCIIALLLVVCMTTLLVACGETDNDNANDDNTTIDGDNNQDNSDNNNGNSISQENAELVLEYINRLTAYGAENLSSYTVVSSIYDKNLSTATGVSKNHGSGCFAEIRLIYSNSTCSINIYNSEQDAINYKVNLEERGIITDTYTCTQKDNILIFAYQQEEFSPFESFVPDANQTFSTEHDYTINTFSSLLYQSHFTIIQGYETFLNHEFADSLIGCMPIIGNCYDMYACALPNSTLNTKTFINGIGTEFTDNSYAKFENDIFYAHVKYKAGFRFEEKDDYCTLTNYCYDTIEGENVIIPSEYNGKNITEIESYSFNSCINIKSVTIPSSVTSIGSDIFIECYTLTSITFQGTKAQWNAILKSEYWSDGTGDFVIHCTDGDLDKDGNEL
ncbi:MAG: leucine-rich repeat protein [Clostridiales bacterium]|nr:leucine-rich repeat protein [Clostridiales bacterium]